MSRTKAIYRTLLAYLLPHSEKLLLYPPKNISFMILENIYNFNDSSVTHSGLFKRGLKPVRTKIGNKLKPDKQSSWVERVEEWASVELRAWCRVDIETFCSSALA